MGFRQIVRSLMMMTVWMFLPVAAWRAMTGAKDPLLTQGRTGTSVNRNFNRGFQNPALLNNQGR